MATGRNAALAKIHMAKADLGIPDVAYRAILSRETGKRSAADLDAQGRGRILEHFRKLGWKPRQSATLAQRLKIKAILRAESKPAAYAEAIARQMFGRSLRRCDSEQLRAVIAALVAARKRKEGASAE